MVTVLRMVKIMTDNFMTHQTTKHCIHILFLLTAILLTASGCSDRSNPNSPEPTLKMGDATDITRTEATITATIERNGGPALSHVTLYYRMEQPERGDELTIKGDPSLSSFTFRLTSLCPGASYSCRLEAGTSTASLTSNRITFTTIPNDPPKVSGIKPLSTGPLGIMVRFSIIDDGGEEILEAGCEIKETESRESRRVYVTGLNPIPEYLWLSIMGLTPGTSYAITPFASNIWGETHGETMEYTTSNSVVLAEPGTLANLFDTSESNDLPLLTISGPMDGDDFRTLRAILGAPAETGIRLRATDIDISDVSIVEGGASYDGQRFTEPDCLSTGLFAGCSRLRSALLPNSANVMERNAFSGCLALEELTVPAGVKELLPSADCPELKDIKVSEANTHFISDQGVLLNDDASEIIWFPCGKTGEYRLPQTIHSIGENAFAGTSITTLIIPPSVTSISRGAFAGSSLTEISIPDNITNISEGMFQNCTELTEVHLGSGTLYIGDFAFYGTSIRDIYLAAETPPFTKEEAFSNRSSTIFGQCTLHVPTGCKKVYTNHRQWGSFSRIVEYQP